MLFMLATDLSFEGELKAIFKQIGRAVGAHAIEFIL